MSYLMNSENAFAALSSKAKSFREQLWETVGATLAYTFTVETTSPNAAVNIENARKRMERQLLRAGIEDSEVKRWTIAAFRDSNMSFAAAFITSDDSDSYEAMLHAFGRAAHKEYGANKRNFFTGDTAEIRAEKKAAEVKKAAQAAARTVAAEKFKRDAAVYAAAADESERKAADLESPTSAESIPVHETISPSLATPAVDTVSAEARENALASQLADMQARFRQVAAALKAAENNEYIVRVERDNLSARLAAAAKKAEAAEARAVQAEKLYNALLETVSKKKTKPVGGGAASVTGSTAVHCPA